MNHITMPHIFDKATSDKILAECDYVDLFHKIQNKQKDQISVKVIDILKNRIEIIYPGFYKMYHQLSKKDKARIDSKAQSLIRQSYSINDFVLAFISNEKAYVDINGRHVSMRCSLSSSFFWNVGLTRENKYKELKGKDTLSSFCNIVRKNDPSNINISRADAFSLFILIKFIKQKIVLVDFEKIKDHFYNGTTLYLSLTIDKKKLNSKSNKKKAYERMLTSIFDQHRVTEDDKVFYREWFEKNNKIYSAYKCDVNRIVDGNFIGSIVIVPLCISMGIENHIIYKSLVFYQINNNAFCNAITFDLPLNNGTVSISDDFCRHLISLRSSRQYCFHLKPYYLLDDTVRNHYGDIKYDNPELNGYNLGLISKMHHRIMRYSSFRGRYIHTLLAPLFRQDIMKMLRGSALSINFDDYSWLSGVKYAENETHEVTEQNRSKRMAFIQIYPQAIKCVVDNKDITKQIDNDSIKSYMKTHGIPKSVTSLLHNKASSGSEERSTNTANRKQLLSMIFERNAYYENNEMRNLLSSIDSKIGNIPYSDKLSKINGMLYYIYNIPHIFFPWKFRRDEDGILTTPEEIESDDIMVFKNPLVFKGCNKDYEQIIRSIKSLYSDALSIAFLPSIPDWNDYEAIFRKHVNHYELPALPDLVPGYQISSENNSDEISHIAKALLFSGFDFDIVNLMKRNDALHDSIAHINIRISSFLNLPVLQYIVSDEDYMKKWPSFDDYKNELGSIHFISDAFSLSCEGHIMKHCVGGYVHDITQDSGVHICHLTTDEGGTTAHIYVDADLETGKLTVNLIEHKAYHNDRPYVKNKKLIADFLNEINKDQEQLKQTFKTIIQKRAEIKQQNGQNPKGDVNDILNFVKTLPESEALSKILQEIVSKSSDDIDRIKSLLFNLIKYYVTWRECKKYYHSFFKKMNCVEAIYYSYTIAKRVNQNVIELSRENGVES